MSINAKQRFQSEDFLANEICDINVSFDNDLNQQVCAADIEEEVEEQLEGVS
jgi:hypothetical protein